MTRLAECYTGQMTQDHILAWWILLCEVCNDKNDIYIALLTKDLLVWDAFCILRHSSHRDRPCCTCRGVIIIIF
jgi:hypothetical protein